MQKIVSNLERQQKRIQQVSTRWRRKGMTIKAIKEQIERNYGITVKDVGLTWDKAKGIFRKKKQSKKQLAKQKELYKKAMRKNVHKKAQMKQTADIVSKEYSKKYVGDELTREQLEKIAKKTGNNLDWENMEQAEYYQELESISDYAENFYKTHTPKEVKKMDKTELDIYKMGAKLLGRSVLGV